jgi:hypothetical protein
MKNNRRNFIICFILISINSSFAQITFVKSYQGIQGKSVQQTFDEGYIFLGYSFTTYSVINLIKTNSYGDTIWTKSYEGIGKNYGYSVKQTLDSGFIIAGTIDSLGAGGYDAFLIKTNANGDTIWTKSYGSTGDDYGYSVKQTLDSGFIIAGAMDILGAQAGDAFLIKTNSTGDTLWTKTYGGDSSDYATSVELTSDGGYIITGYTKSFGAGKYDVYLIKTNSTGDTLWTKTYGSGYNDYGYSVKQTFDGGFIISGTFIDGNFYLIKTNSVGDTVWTKAFSFYNGMGISDEAAYSVQQTTDSGYIIAGLAQNWVEGWFENVLIKTNSAGDSLWMKFYDGSMHGPGNFVQQTTDGGYIVLGGSSLIKTDSNGNSGCLQVSSLIEMNSNLSQVSSTSTIINSGCIVGNPTKLVRSGSTTITTECLSDGINNIKTTNYLTIGPNPAKDYITINSNAEIFNANLEILNVLGEKVYSTKLSGTQNIINCESFSPGIYFMLVNAGGELNTKKLILNK